MKEFYLTRDHETTSMLLKKVTETHYTWYSAQYFCGLATTNLKSALDLWNRVKTEMRTNKTQAFKTVSQARGKLLEVVNLYKSIHYYLGNYEIPYISKSEVKTLSDALRDIYKSASEEVSYQEAAECFQIIYENTRELEKWFKEVIFLKFLDISIYLPYYLCLNSI